MSFIFKDLEEGYLDCSHLTEGLLWPSKSWIVMKNKISHFVKFSAKIHGATLPENRCDLLMLLPNKFDFILDQSSEDCIA